MRSSIAAAVRQKTVATPALVNGLLSSTGGTSTAFSGFAATVGNFLVVVTSNYTTGGVAISSITDSAGNTWRKAGVSLHANGDHTFECWYAVDCNAHSNNVVTINWAASATLVQAYLGQFSGVSRQVSGFDVQSALKLDGSTTTTHTTNATPSLSVLGELIIGLFVNWDGGTFAITPSDGTLIAANGDYGQADFKVASDVGGQTMTITTASANRFITGVWAFSPLRT